MGTVLWLVPHQDDETLTMGVGVRHHREAGHRVVTVVCTDGSASGVRGQLGMSVEEFVAARDDEYARAARKLGVGRADIRWAPGGLLATDGELTADVVEQIVDMMLAEYGPDCLLKGTTDLAPAQRHPDHVAVGAGLRRFADRGHDVRFYIEGYDLAAVKTAVPGLTVSTEKCAAPAAVVRACTEYKLVDTPAGMYGIGYRSVAAEFDQLTTNVVSYYHVP